MGKTLSTTCHDASCKRLASLPLPAWPGLQASTAVASAPLGQRLLQGLVPLLATRQALQLPVTGRHSEASHPEVRARTPWQGGNVVLYSLIICAGISMRRVWQQLRPVLRCPPTDKVPAWASSGQHPRRASTSRTSSNGETSIGPDVTRYYPLVHTPGLGRATVPQDPPGPLLDFWVQKATQWMKGVWWRRETSVSQEDGEGPTVKLRARISSPRRVTMDRRAKAEPRARGQPALPPAGDQGPSPPRHRCSWWTPTKPSTEVRDP